MSNKLLRSRIVLAYGNASAFADALGVSKSYVSAKVTGRKRMTRRDIEKWGPALDIAVSEYPAFFPAYFADLHEKEVF